MIKCRPLPKLPIAEITKRIESARKPFANLQVIMGLEYTSGCVNFRDVGESLALVANADIFPEGKLFRGGKIDYIKDIATIQNPATILNLRRGIDPQHLPAAFAHISASNDLEKYETHNREVRRWLNKIVAFFANDQTKFPVLVHCTSGKDRTGVVVAALLLIVGINRNFVVDEYLLSDGEVKQEWIEMAIDGMDNPEVYFNRVKLDVVRRHLLT